MDEEAYRRILNAGELMAANESFDNVCVQVGRFMVEWRCCGEQSGENSLGFFCFIRDARLTSGWRQLERGYYTTELPATIGLDKLLVTARRIIEILQECWPYEHVPTAPEAVAYHEQLLLMSHITVHNFGLRPPRVQWPTQTEPV